VYSCLARNQSHAKRRQDPVPRPPAPSGLASPSPPVVREKQNATARH
jgi:hypothetical protein